MATRCLARRADVRFIAGADDRLFPPELQQRVADERLGIDDVDIIPGGHLVAMANPALVADRLVRGAR